MNDRLRAALTDGRVAQLREAAATGLTHLTDAAVVSDDRVRVALENQRPDVGREPLERAGSDRVQTQERHCTLVRARLLHSRREPASRHRTRTAG
jgi:hypothetical protein